ncbi:MAG: toll/interleukin-1 receptor domain-containing protein [Rhodocyclaceae bacterium]|nr:toll/interleukin-1 receptor domain-containing protein [Rhodocyclaceae bacterium]
MTAIFISYRRDDSEGHAGRLFEGLRARFGADAVFMDVVAIEPGVDFRQAIDEHVDRCDVLLAVIGPRWLSACAESGERRIDQPGDFVGLEIAAALRRGIPVVPVLVQGATMPGADALPPELADFAYRNAVALTHARWTSDLEVLAKALERIIAPTAGAPAGATAPEPVRKRRWLVPAVLLVAAVAVAGVFSLRGGAQPKAKPTTGTSAVRVDGRAVTRVVYAGQDGGKPHGYFTQTAKGTWVEYDAGNDRSFTFRELNRNGDGVALRDDSRGITILLDLKRGLVQLRAGNAAPRPLYRIRSAQ